MNSKNSLFIFCVFFLCGCGVKSPPLKHPEVIVDSYIGNYTSDKELSPEEAEQPPKKAPINATDELAAPEKK